MLRKILFLFCLAAPVWSLAAEKGPEAKKQIPAQFQGGGMATFERWVMSQLVFPETHYTEGELSQVLVSFEIDKSGKTRQVKLLSSPQEPVAKQVLDLLKTSSWAPAREQGKPVLTQQLLKLEMLLRSGPEQSLVAEDYKCHKRADSMPQFEGKGPGTFIRWIADQVGDEDPDGKTFNARVIVQFCIEKDGSMTDLRVENVSAKWLIPRIKAAFAAAPRWSSPALVEGQPVRLAAVLTLRLGAQQASESPSDEDRIFPMSETMPKFNDGSLMEFRSWLMSRILYPAEAVHQRIHGRVVICFVIEKDGRLSQAEVKESPSDLLSNEAMRVVLRSPRWTPGEQGGKPVRVKYTLPLDFSLP